MKYNITDNFLDIKDHEEFEKKVLFTFRFQVEKNNIYKKWTQLLNIDPKNVDSIYKIPFLPISFFKSERIVTGDWTEEIIFTSSGTSGMSQSKHFVKQTDLYQGAFKRAFQHFYGNIEDYLVFALLPSYLEREGSSLIYMAEDFIKTSKHPDSGFFLNDHQKLFSLLKKHSSRNSKILLLGVSFALLDFVEKYNLKLPKQAIVMETGGMKGKRKEISREELHSALKKGFGVKNIHSEYGMTELLSQSYSQQDGVFKSPNFMKVLLRDVSDPLKIITESDKKGAINVIDLANFFSCSFIATDDLGKIYRDGSFEVLGRLSDAEIRGCNMLLE